MVAGTLLDIKSTIGVPDGAHTAVLACHDIDKLLGYLPLDYSDTYGLATVGVYDARSGRLVTWPLTWFCTQLAGGEVEVSETRTRFKYRARAGSMEQRSVGKEDSVVRHGQSGVAARRLFVVRRSPLQSGPRDA